MNYCLRNLWEKPHQHSCSLWKFSQECTLASHDIIPCAHSNKDAVNRGQLKTFCWDICSNLQKNMPVKHRYQGTKIDVLGKYSLTCAKMIAKQTCRSRVDLPPMFGPVRRMKLGQPAPPTLMSLGTKEPLPKMSLRRTGWPRPFTDK